MTDWQKRALAAEAELAGTKSETSARSAIEAALRGQVPASILADFTDLALIASKRDDISFDADGDATQYGRPADVGSFVRSFIAERRATIDRVVASEGGKQAPAARASTGGPKPSTRLLEENDDEMNVEVLMTMGFENMKKQGV